VRLRLGRPDWLTGGALRLLLLAAFIVAVGMIRPRLTQERATVLVLVGAAVAVAGALLFLGGARRLARTVPLPAPERMGAAVLAELRHLGLPLLGLAFFLVWTLVYAALWAVHPEEAFRGLGDRPRFADFFYYAVSTAFTSPPEDIVATSRGARSATLIEMLSGLALLGVYLSSFVDWQRPQRDSTSERSLSPRPDRQTST
jgi:hypothetical protein